MGHGGGSALGRQCVAVSPLGGVGFRPVEVANPFAKRLRRRREVPSVEAPAVGDADSHASAVMGRGKNLLFPMPITHYPFPINDLN
jgi:hypothetical protein